MKLGQILKKITALYLVPLTNYPLDLCNGVCSKLKSGVLVLKWKTPFTVMIDTSVNVLGTPTVR